MNTEKPSTETPETDKNPGETTKTLSGEKNGFADLGLKEPTRFGDWEVRGRCSDF